MLTAQEKSLLLLRNLAYNSSHLHHQSQRQERQQREGEEGEGLQGGKPSPPANSLQTWSRGAVLPAVKAVLQRPHPSSAVRPRSTTSLCAERGEGCVWPAWAPS